MHLLFAHDIQNHMNEFCFDNGHCEIQKLSEKKMAESKQEPYNLWKFFSSRQITIHTKDTC